MKEVKILAVYAIAGAIAGLLCACILNLIGCSPTSAEQPAPVASFGHVLQVVNEIESPKPKEVGEVEHKAVAPPSLAAMQLTINLANYYATRCLEDGTVNEECLNEAMKCAGQLKQQDNMTDALLKCVKSINP